MCLIGKFHETYLSVAPNHWGTVFPMAVITILTRLMTDDSVSLVLLK